MVDFPGIPEGAKIMFQPAKAVCGICSEVGVASEMVIFESPRGTMFLLVHKACKGAIEDE